ncbi:hypothetical protein BCR43DRAFT_458274 [Syncephalastrum racemosum]|uniref:RING-type domain-containing protein n=1 Tax=Syncephalastrum racemosum TaxID=13706 RepID=A0A1X2HE17_SYNRA|nr:hypothetical protein BCR43DRAFT_458274 [Syncephalastrum racemosum]
MPNEQENVVDLRSLQYVGTVNANLICCICQVPFIDPVVLPCGHTFCQTCIYQACESSPICPFDRSAVSLDDIQPAVKIISNMVNELDVHCPRSEEGCGYVGQRQYIENHVKSSCLYAFAACDLDECKELVLKKDLHSHVEACKYRATECSMCKKKLRAYELEDHHEQCPAEIIECPYCTTSRPRSEHSTHLDTCPQHPVNCEHSSFGCQWSGQRYEQDTHLELCPYEGIKAFLRQQQQQQQMLRDELNTVRKENTTLKRQQSDQRREIEALAVRLEEMQEFSQESEMKTEFETLSASMANLELKQNMALMTETFRLQEEIQSLRAVCHGMRMQMHFLLMDRRNSAAAPPPTSAASSSAAAAAAAAGVNASEGQSLQALNRMRSWLDAPGPRQDTKL